MSAGTAEQQAFGSRSKDQNAGGLSDVSWTVRHLKEWIIYSNTQLCVVKSAIKRRAATERSENTSLHDFEQHSLYQWGLGPEHDFRLFEYIQTILDIRSNVVHCCSTFYMFICLPSSIKPTTRRSWRAVLRACAWFRQQLEGWERIERWRSDQPAHVGWLS